MFIKYSPLVFLTVFMGASLYFVYPKVENSFLFYPVFSFDRTPEDFDLTYRDIYFITEDGEKLHGWFFPLPGSNPTLLFCHGNAGNISHRLENIRLLLEKQLQVFIFDYRGFGRSSGKPSENGVYRDGLAAYDYLVQKERSSPHHIVLFGRSLGASVAIEIARKREVKSIIIEGAFTSTRDMAKTMLLFKLLSPLLPAHYNNLEKITEISIPKLIIHSEDDEIVPFAMGEKLLVAAKPPKFFFPLKGSGHNDTYLVGGEKYLHAISAFARDPSLFRPIPE